MDELLCMAGNNVAERSPLLSAVKFFVAEPNPKHYSLLAILHAFFYFTLLILTFPGFL